MKTTRKTKSTAIQKRIKKRLIDADLRRLDIAEYYGVSNAYISKQIREEKEEYFIKAINDLKNREKSEV